MTFIRRMLNAKGEPRYYVRPNGPGHPFLTYKEALTYAQEVDSDFEPVVKLPRGLTREEYITRCLEYRDGNLYWKIRVNGNMRSGDQAGANDGNGYLEVGIQGKLIKVHRIVWYLHHGHLPPEHTDHKNGNRKDNRIENLRSVSQAENNKNVKKPKTNTSGTVGVGFCKTKKRYFARITSNGITYNLITTKIEEEAIRARKEAEVRFGFHKNHGRD